MTTRFSKKLLARMLVFLSVFVAAVLAVFWHTGQEPDTLVLAVFGFCAAEGGLLAWIRTTKTKVEGECNDGGTYSGTSELVDKAGGAVSSSVSNPVDKEQDY